MKAISHLFLALSLLAGCRQGAPSDPSAAARDKDAPTASVSDPARRYFGLHFDFHASPVKIGEGHRVGETLKGDDIRQICRQIRPDFIQVDSKGHPGWASFPTTLDNAMPAFVGDPLRLWRQVTREEGIALYAHYSGVADERYAERHPEEAAKGPDGKPAGWAVRTNGTYADSLLIPQLCELAGKYGLDGVWVDGECWATVPDYDPRTTAAFRCETGQDERQDPEAFKDYCRDLFRNYLRHYVDAVHARYPDFRICSNWAFSDYMPEPVSAGLDFLSGDFRAEDAIYWSRIAGRALCKQGKPWDLMAWSFRRSPEGQVPKHPVQLMQEAASVIALGGGFQVYVTQHVDGSPRTPRVLELSPLASFLREREAWTYGGVPRKEIAILLSAHDRYRETDGLFSRAGLEKITGLVNLLCEAGRSVSILSEHDLPQAAAYPVIIVPELFTEPEAKTADALLDYTRQGGVLVLVGEKSCRCFRQAAGMAGENAAEATGNATARPFGQGHLAFFPEPLGSKYFSGARWEYREMMTSTLDSLFRPGARVVRAHGLLEIVDMDKDGKHLIQLVNAGGQHHNLTVLTEDSLPPVCDIVLELRCKQKPRLIRLQPEGKRLRWSWKDNTATVLIPRLDIHGTVEVVD